MTELTEHSTFTNLASQITLRYSYKTGLTEHSTITNLASQITLRYLYKTGLTEHSAILLLTWLLRSLCDTHTKQG